MEINRWLLVPVCLFGLIASEEALRVLRHHPRDLRDGAEIFIGGLSRRGCRGASNGSWETAQHDPCAEDDFIDAEQRKIKEHVKLLAQEGRMVSDYPMPFSVLGRYDWHTTPGGYFGAYSFYEPAFQQARRAWFFNGEVLEGSNELWTGALNGEIRFTAAALGQEVTLSMNWFERGRYRQAYFTAKTQALDPKNEHILLLDRRAPHHAEMYRMALLPRDWVDYCNCTNNFNPWSSTQ